MIIMVYVDTDHGLNNKRHATFDSEIVEQILFCKGKRRAGSD
jgi:hypothetical protein